MIQADYIIIGSGLTGATLARLLHDSGKEVIVIDRRSHIGGNVYDSNHKSGIRIHTYGPHYFRTSSDRIWEFVNRFSTFYPYSACLKSYVDGQYENWPVSIEYIERCIGKNWQPSFRGKPENFEEACLAMMPEIIYNKFVKGYTEKQWGVPANTLSCSLARRFDVRHDNDPRLKLDRYQGIPVDGYASFMANMLQGIPIILNCDFSKYREVIKAKYLLIYTGPIDEYFNFDMGKLGYRSQLRETYYVSKIENNKNYIYPSGQINNPNPNLGNHIRTLEWKHMMMPPYSHRIQGSVITQETPYTPDNPDAYEYPFPDENNVKLFNLYKNRANFLNQVIICGRLGEYKYYDMDQAIARAFAIFKKILPVHSEV